LAAKMQSEHAPPLISVVGFVKLDIPAYQCRCESINFGCLRTSVTLSDASKPYRL